MATVFLTDQQTVNDIGIFDKKAGIFELYNKTRTRGGHSLLESMFRSPLTDPNEINSRTAIIDYFRRQEIAFPFDPELIGAGESYLADRDERSRLSGDSSGFANRIGNLIATDQQRLIIHKGIHALVSLFKQLNDFLAKSDLAVCFAYNQYREKAIQILSSDQFSPILDTAGQKLSTRQLADFDGIFRFKQYDLVNRILQQIFFLDAIISVARSASEYGWTPASIRHYNQSNTAFLEITDVKHPFVRNARVNTVRFDGDQNVYFLTGANMAGKSTLMKSIGLAVYLAHVGFPVSASAMTFTVMDGFYSTINLPDDLGMGASHFYAEVLRLKKVAGEISAGKRLFVMFDELFRGTNVKDAEEATIAVAQRFVRRKNCLFVISTHIIEAGETLKVNTPGIQYHYMPTIMDGTTPRYSYRIMDGITADRHGMLILQNEKVLEILQSGSDHQHSAKSN
jgi:DNA mismatch repair protein MutS